MLSGLFKYGGSLPPARAVFAQKPICFSALRHVILAKIVWPQMQLSRDARHFMVTKQSISSELRSPLKDELCYHASLWILRTFADTSYVLFVRLVASCHTFGRTLRMKKDIVLP
jgi:hypothetical protein